ncbi:MAG TPA: protein-glutamate O-methyltransferase CheR [Candidatus Competibacter sp.]|jgi:chemotaxis protein methyltransferase CheR|nr:protein-glutamate O-methyltransferase CheR [Candidatus Competibacter sp.]HRX62437.1 protein-glutamate O-methyltransferase CheR [Candidatus Competibacter sp.]
MIAISKSDFNYVRDLVRRHSAISLEPDKAYLIETRLAPLARQTGFDSLQALIASLRTNPGADLRDRVIEAMFTHETSFFRDGHPFEILKSVILPSLLAKRPLGQNLIIWCAACSSGQEPFSVAMLAREHFPDLARGRLRMIATDLSESILARAREGLYTQTEINRGLPPALLARYFDKQGSCWRLKLEIRRMVDFQRSNLAEEWPNLPSPDIIFMRNVLIYFDQETKKSILSKVRKTLKPDGYLILGSSETTLNLDPTFESISIGKTVCYQLRHG